MFVFCIQKYKTAVSLFSFIANCCFGTDKDWGSAAAQWKRAVWRHHEESLYAWCMCFESRSDDHVSEQGQ